MKQPIVITIDSGVGLPGTTTNNAALYAQNRDKLIAMPIGDSFFLEDQTREDVAGLIRYAKRHLVHLQAVEVESDEVYHAPGVRVGRVEQEELPGRKPTTVAPPVDGKTYWINRKTNVRYTCEPGVRPDDRKAVQISQAEFDLDKNATAPVLDVKTRYFVDHNSKSTFETTATDEDIFCSPLDVFEEVEESQYLLFQAEFSKGTEYTYWSVGDSDLRVQYLPGKRPVAGKYVHEVTAEEYIGYQNTQVPFTFWMKKDNTCVKVPREKLEKAYKTPGAVQITVNEYNDWLAAQEDDEL